MKYTKEQIEAGLNKLVSKDDTKNELTEKGFQKIKEAIQSGDRIERKEWYLEYPITSTIIVNIFMFLLYLVTEKTIFVNVASTLTIMLPLFMLIDTQVLVNRFMIGKLFLPHNKNINEILSICGINIKEKKYNRESSSNIVNSKLCTANHICKMVYFSYSNSTSNILYKSNRICF